MIERTFQNITEGKLNEAEQHSYLDNMGWPKGATWADLLRSKRVLMISEAGTGKTYECSKQANQLWNEGEPAFFVDLSGLASGDLRSLLDNEEETRLDAWLASQSDVATFFLDSFDELKLSLGSFEIALKRFKKAIGNQLGRTRVVITTRPVPIDEQLVHSLLPIPPIHSTESNGEAFAKIAMGEHQTQQIKDKDDAAAPDWRTVALMPLSDEQIVEFARLQGVEEPAVMLEDLKTRNAQEFARRPQDLIELCADWREHKRIRTHRDQVAANVRVKLQPRDDGPEPAELSIDKATEGASRLALAMIVTRRMTIRHNAASDDNQDEVAFDPAKILTEWKPNERRALLERPLFGFASYGRVRFHHRSVVEYLAAKRLQALRVRGMPFRALKRLLFAQTKDKTIVRPSMRPIAGWLALVEDRIFEILRDHEPDVLVNEGDPQTLSQSQRNQVLLAYVQRYSQGDWRGLSVPQIQVHRFASPKLADDLNQLWQKGIENPDVRQILLKLIAAGCIGNCADIAHDVACDVNASAVERILAVDALVAIRDARLNDITADVASAGSIWPENIARGVLLRLFPLNLTVDQLCQTLNWVKEPKHSAGDLDWQLPRLIATAEIDPEDLVALRSGLVQLLSAGLCWQEEWPHVTCDRLHLSNALAATCVRGLERSNNDDWLHASVLALRLYRRYSNSDAHNALHERLTNLSAVENARLFWAEDSLVQSLHPIPDPWKRLVEVTLDDGPVELRAERDLGWIKTALGDQARSVDDRALLLEAAMRLSPTPKQWRDHVSRLKPLVADRLDLIENIELRLKSAKRDKEQERWKKKQAKQKKQQDQQHAEDKASWMKFWHEVAEHPEDAFSPESSWNTAWNLWQAMSQEGEESRASGWDRRFIEKQFGKETADRLRSVLMEVWRKDRPTLPSERPEDQRGTFLHRWQLGLAALYAEAEDPTWATKLSEEEAALAVRYAPIETNGLPTWIENLVDDHPGAVEAILGKELSWELEREPIAHGHSILLQDISYASESVVRLFLPFLREWLDKEGVAFDEASNLAAIAGRLRQVMGVMLTHGNEDSHTHVLAIARERLQYDIPKELAFIWLSVLMRLDPDLGVSMLEDRIRTVEPGARTEAVELFGVLFGDRNDPTDLKTPQFTPQLLLRLLRRAYHHVRIVDDTEHHGTYSPDIRDHAESARDEIVTALLDAKGEKGWAAKLEMANDPLCAHFKDRILAITKEHWAQDIDSVPYDEKQAIALDKTGEAPASTNEAMFAIMKDRLADLDELLLSDTSPKEAWAGITLEKLLRREIARELHNSANGLYKVDQEAVTADENKTDIRLRSVVSNHEAVIELKRADGKWSARDLRDTIYKQLVKKYMSAENTKSGCLLLTLAKDRKWKHPDTGKIIQWSELISLLHDEAQRVEKSMGGVTLVVHPLDLRPPLPIQ